MLIATFNVRQSTIIKGIVTLFTATCSDRGGHDSDAQRSPIWQQMQSRE